MNKLKTVRGVHDLMPSTFYKHSFIINSALKISNSFCYEQIDTPIFEFAEIFIKPLGESSDIVKKENYLFEDRSGDLLMLRPEGTSGVVRALLNAGLTQSIPQRFSYSGPMFRYERPQKGRLRQFHQFGIELLGIKDPMADIEVISIGYSFLDSLGLSKKVELRINSLGDQESRLNYRKALLSYLKDYKNELSLESQKKLIENPLRILDSKNSSDKKILVNAPDVFDYLNLESKTRFQKVCKGLDNLKIKYKLDKNLVRGLDYYCHTAFEFITDELGAQGTVLAGGRYDGLSEMLGSIPMAGVGWAAGIERLVSMVEIKYSSRPDVTLIAISDENNLDLLQTFNQLIKAGLKVEMIYNGNLAKKFKRADKINSIFAIIIGEEEITQNLVQLKNLRTGIQELIKLDDAVIKIKNQVDRIPE